MRGERQRRHHQRLCMGPASGEGLLQAPPLPAGSRADMRTVFRGYFLSRAGIRFPARDGDCGSGASRAAGSGDDEEQVTVQVCHRCLGALRKRKMPQFAIANGLDLGPAPTAAPLNLPKLTWVEECVVARVRVRGYICKLGSRGPRTTRQTGLKGHVISFPPGHEGAGHRPAASRALAAGPDPSDLHRP